MGKHTFRRTNLIFCGFLQSWNSSWNCPPVKKLLQRVVEMGARESRCLSWALTDKQGNALAVEQAEDESEACSENVEETESTSEETSAGQQDPPPVSQAVLDFAEKMSQEVVAQALLLCWEEEIRYKELPFIDIECEYII